MLSPPHITHGPAQITADRRTDRSARVAGEPRPGGYAPEATAAGAVHEGSYDAPSATETTLTHGHPTHEYNRFSKRLTSGTCVRSINVQPCSTCVEAADGAGAASRLKQVRFRWSQLRSRSPPRSHPDAVRRRRHRERNGVQYAGHSNRVGGRRRPAADAHRAGRVTEGHRAYGTAGRSHLLSLVPP